MKLRQHCRMVKKEGASSSCSKSSCKNDSSCQQATADQKQ
jgi:hypothetical protein